MMDLPLNVSMGLSLSLVIIFTLLSIITLWPEDNVTVRYFYNSCTELARIMCNRDSNLQEQISYNLADLDDIKENVAYGTALHELIQTEDNKAYIKTEQIQFVENQAYGTADHERIQLKCNEAYERTRSELPTAAVGKNEQVTQFYEQISFNDSSEPVPTQQQQQLGTQSEGNDEAYD